MPLPPTATQQNNRFRQSVSSMPDASYTSIWNDGQQSMGQTIEQVQAYRDWNYVVINKMNQLVSGQCPIVGRKPTPGRTLGNGQRLTQRLRERHYVKRWNQLYGARLQAIADEVEVVEQHPLVELLDRVNEEDTWADLASELNLYLELTGCAYLWCVPSSLMLPSGHLFPAEIVVIPTHWVEELRNHQTGELLGWKVTWEGQTRPMVLQADELIPFRFKSPLGKRAWTSPTQQTASWVDASAAIGNTRVASMANRGNPSMIMVPDKDTYKSLEDDDARALANRVAARARSIEQHGMPLVTPPGFDVKPWSMKPIEMGFIESDEQLRDALFAARGFSKFVAGLTKDMNRSDVEAALVQASEFSINPRLSFIAGRLTEKLAKRWDPGLLVWFDDMTPDSWERELAETDQDWKMGALSPDERREARGRKPLGLETSQTGYVASTMLPLMDEPDEPVEEEPDDVAPEESNEEDQDGEES